MNVDAYTKLTLSLHIAGVRADGRPIWSYHRCPHGPRVELVSREIQPGLEGYWASA